MQTRVVLATKRTLAFGQQMEPRPLTINSGQNKWSAASQTQTQLQLWLVKLTSQQRGRFHERQSIDFQIQIQMGIVESSQMNDF